MSDAREILSVVNNRMAKHLRDVNVNISEVTRRYIISKGKRMKVTGPVFVGISAEVVE